MYSLLLLLFLLPDSTHGLLCVANEKYEYNLIDLQNKMDELEHEVLGSVSAEKCYVSIQVDHHTGKLRIEYHRQSYNDTTTDAVNLEIEILLSMNVMSISNTFTHTCSFKDYCDRVFVQNKIRSLFNFDFLQFQDGIKKIFINNYNDDYTSGMCYDKDKTVYCSSHVCFGKSQQEETSSTCLKKNAIPDKLKSLKQFNFLQIEIRKNFWQNDDPTYFDSDVHQLSYNISYFCTSKGCNNPHVLESLANTVKMNYDIPRILTPIARNRNDVREAAREESAEATTRRDATTWAATTMEANGESRTQLISLISFIFINLFLHVLGEH